MQTKLFELRDRATFVPVLAVKVEAANEFECYLLRRSGYSLPSDLIILTGLAGGLDKSTCDPYDWGSNRTRLFAHKYIAENFDKLQSGQVIDVEFILGETEKPKESERLTA
jgi:hypothetical protein